MRSPEACCSSSLLILLVAAEAVGVEEPQLVPHDGSAEAAAGVVELFKRWREAQAARTQLVGEIVRLQAGVLCDVLKLPEKMLPPSLGTMFIWTPPVLRSADMPPVSTMTSWNVRLLKTKSAALQPLCQTVHAPERCLRRDRHECRKALPRSSRPPTLCQTALPRSRRE